MTTHEAIFSTDIDLFWSDMDALGHLNNVAYFRYMEEVRAKWLLSLGEDFTHGATGPVLYDTQCTYLKPVVYPQTLHVELFAEPPRRSSVNLLYQFTQDKKQLVARASSRLVWVDYQKMKSISLPETLKQQLL